MKILKVAITTVLILFSVIVVSAILLVVMARDYRVIYPYYMIFSSDIDFPKMHIFVRACDQYANAVVIEDKYNYNMVLIITLQKHLKDLPEEEISCGRLLWRSNPRSWNYAKFSALLSDLGLEVGVHLHKNSLVIIDGMTNETLLVHEISREQTEQWNKGFSKRCNETDFNVIEDACKFWV